MSYGEKITQTSHSKSLWNQLEGEKKKKNICINYNLKKLIGTELGRFLFHKEIKWVYAGSLGSNKREGYILCLDFCPSCDSENPNENKGYSVWVQTCSWVNRLSPPHFVLEYLINTAPNKDVIDILRSQNGESLQKQ